MEISNAKSKKEKTAAKVSGGTIAAVFSGFQNHVLLVEKVLLKLCRSEVYNQPDLCIQQLYD